MRTIDVFYKKINLRTINIFGNKPELQPILCVLEKSVKFLDSDLPVETNHILSSAMQQMNVSYVLNIKNIFQFILSILLMIGII